MESALIGSNFHYVWKNAWEELISGTEKAKEQNEWWQGRIAFKELGNRAKLVLPGEGSPLLYLLLQHLRCFRRLAARALDERDRYQAEHDAFLAKAEATAEFLKQDTGLDPELKANLTRHEHQMRFERWVRDEHLKQFWEVQFLPYDRGKWSHPTWEHPKFSWTQDFPVPPEIIANAERVFQTVQYPANYETVANLHTWLQIRAAVLFKLFLSQPSPSCQGVPELSLLTTARLIFLLYERAGLGSVHDLGDGKFVMKVTQSDDDLTILAIYEKLRRYGVHKVSFVDMGIPNTLIKGPTGDPGFVEALYCRDFFEFVDKFEKDDSVVPLTFLHVLDSPRFVEDYSDNTIEPGLSIDDTILHGELESEGYTLVGMRDRKGVFLVPFATSPQKNAAREAARYALKDSVRGEGPGTS
jgi:hypothetical protein